MHCRLCVSDYRISLILPFNVGKQRSWHEGMNNVKGSVYDEILFM